MSEVEQVVVAPSDWVTTAQSYKEQGFDYLDFLSVRELESGNFVVTAHLLGVETMARILVEGEWTVEASGAIPSLSDVFAGARWHEREAAELFGIGFASASVDFTDAGLLDASKQEPFISNQPALRRNFALEPRLETEWPGTNEPGLAPDHPRRKRKRAVPGNPPTWETEA